MRRFLAFIFVTAMVLSPMNIWAAPPGFSGGVNNEYEYEEVVFISGEPIVVKGEIKVSERIKDTEKSVSYSFKLENKDKDAKLSRKIKVETLLDKRDDKGQTIEQSSITGYSEKVTIGEDKYELEDFQLSKSDVIDNRPASDFYNGNMQGRKYYKVNKDQGEVIIDISGQDVGYKNFWGNSETQIINYSIRNIKPDDSDGSWEGHIKASVSDSTTKVLKYSDNEANFSSFNGGHMRVTNEQMVSRYEYDLPEIDNGEIDDDERDKGTVKLNKTMVPKLERLIVPKFRDLGGHWAQSYIEKLYSLDVFDENGEFFSPDLPMNRMEFTKGVIRACDIRTYIEEPKRRSRREPPEESVFEDLDTKDDDYKYVKSGYEKGIIHGENNKFKPNNNLTRAQAITIFVRALGFENKAPTPGYYTSFSDDREIPYWAKDSIYMAKEIGLIQGDKFNKVNPNKVMSRAEASAMLVRFLEFLERDLQRDYRENIIYFN
ncbi:S-layer homology domain-containing protein [Tepidibacter aestuarii]|uniref:S-layer homology domain-containing protein n=1 Tax=Tepidibacter aestuarii TaxID=2925782 RepID=UPI0020C09F71|nr:S-layer homology domain-containing protein [Tepidibacter aestuarii]CAH2215087.1 S-layer homology domain-containing protein [Tepidibacter aestuarii]